MGRRVVRPKVVPKGDIADVGTAVAYCMNVACCESCDRRIAWSRLQDIRRRHNELKTKKLRLDSHGK